MNLRRILLVLLAVVPFGISGCKDAPGKPRAGVRTRPARAGPRLQRPLPAELCRLPRRIRQERRRHFPRKPHLSRNGRTSANIQRITAAGVPGTMMPAFGKAAGGSLTDQQIAILAHGMITTWGNPGTLGGAHPTRLRRRIQRRR